LSCQRRGQRRAGRDLGLVGTLVFSALLAAPVAAEASSSSAAVPQGGVGVRLIPILPAPSDPRAKIYVIARLAPGSVLQRQIAVSNTTGSALEVAVYAGAASISGGSFLGASGTTSNELSGWTSVSPRTLQLPAGGMAAATVKVMVPQTTSPGERYAVVWAQVSSSPDASGVVRVSRVGIRLYISVGPGGPPPADMTVRSLTAERSSSGAPEVVALVTNSGGLALDLLGSLQLSGGPEGLSAGPYPATLGVTLGVGQTEPVRVVLGGQIPAGPWNALMTLRSGLLERSVRATITFPAAGTATPVPAMSVPSGGLGLVGPTTAAVVIVGLGGLGLHLRRRGHRRNWRSR